MRPRQPSLLTSQVAQLDIAITPLPLADIDPPDAQRMRNRSSLTLVLSTKIVGMLVFAVTLVTPDLVLPSELETLP